MSTITKSGKKFEVHDTKKYGNGVFAGQDFKKGEVIYVMSGKRVTLNQVVDAIVSGKEAPNDPLQVGRKTYIDLDEFSRTFNHSCEPNVGMRKRSELFALRDIKKGEQITFDYSMTVAPTDWSMKCECGSKNCRGIIHDIRTIPKSQLNLYIKLGAVQRYMKPILFELDRKTYTVPKYEINAMKIIMSL